MAVVVTIDNKPAVTCGRGTLTPRGRARGRVTHRECCVDDQEGTAICWHHLADRGLLHLAAPAAAYWPEFAQTGKAAIPVRLPAARQLAGQSV